MMTVILKLALLIVGFVVLIYGADFFVDGASKLAKRFNIPSFVIGLTICAFGTSAPELAVSVTASVSGANSLAIGNVLGSNFFNLMVVLGVCAVINPIPVTKNLLRRDYPVSIAAITLLSVFLMSDSDISRFEALILFCCLVGYMTWTIVDTKKHPELADTQEEDTQEFVAWKCALYIVGGCAAIVLGGDLVVESAKYLGGAIGMSEKLIGFTICAIGTSLPELVTSYTASKKGQNDMAMGNVIGSNIFNILCILGISGLISPISIGDANINATLLDCGINVGVCILAYIFCITGKKVERWEGLVLVGIYLSYMAYNIVKDLF
ncbi:MAG: calcium/sodium antiporter [Paludibacteraceae bacterium]|jgi:cation:H+ antiporter|nr:calcium/sodium antiporter [Paludibacteraceae bacterium]MEE1260729.1 calcium/sodium antiporter [Paludibacteraceae bacterium]